MPEGTIVRVYCPYCDKPYTSLSRRKGEARMRIHVNGQHPEMPNPFESNEI